MVDDEDYRSTYLELTKINLIVLSVVVAISKTGLTEAVTQESSFLASIILFYVVVLGIYKLIPSEDGSKDNDGEVGEYIRIMLLPYFLLLFSIEFPKLSNYIPIIDVSDQTSSFILGLTAWAVFLFISEIDYGIKDLRLSKTGETVAKIGISIVLISVSYYVMIQWL
jgi:fumarate reductase subunit D